MGENPTLLLDHIRKGKKILQLFHEATKILLQSLLIKPWLSYVLLKRALHHSFKKGRWSQSETYGLKKLKGFNNLFSKSI